MNAIGVMKWEKIQPLLTCCPKSGYKSPLLSYPLLYCVAIIIEIFYAYIFGFVYSDHIFSSDAPTYIRAIDSLAMGKLDLTRTPTYPLILGLTKFIFGKAFVKAVVTLQITAYFISSIFFQRIVAKFVYSSKVTFWIVAYYLLGIGFNQYHYHLMTESFSITGVVILLYILLRNYSNQLHLKDVVFAVTILFILVYLRPVFVYLIPVLVIYFISLYFYHKIGLKVLAVGLLGLGLVTTSIGLYTSAMYKTYGIKSICIVNTYNNYFMLRHSGLLNDKYTDNPILEKKIKEINTQPVYRPFNGRIWSEINRLTRNFDGKNYTPGDFEEFVYRSLKENKRGCLKTLRSRLFAEDTVFPTLYEYELLSTAHLSLYPSLLQSIMMLFALFLYWILEWRKNKQFSISSLLLIMVVGGLWVSSFVGAYGDFHRLCIPVMPAFLILLGSVSNEFSKRVKEQPVVTDKRTIKTNDYAFN